jgi:two-component system, OmpR family, response regulator
VNILLVEDDGFYRDTLSRMVRGWGHDVVWAETGRGGLERAFAMDFDLFLLDVFLPDMTAMDLIPRIRAFRPEARVITLTGQSSRSLELKLRELGIAYYMAKPVPAAELKSILDHMGRRDGGRSALPADFAPALS